MHFKIMNVNKDIEIIERESLEIVLEEINSSQPFFIFHSTKNNRKNKKTAWHKDFIVSVVEAPEETLNSKPIRI